MQKEIGKRLGELKAVFKSGEPASTAEFAEELGEKTYNIGNYLNGKAGVPNRVQAALYRKGFNLNYLISGEGSPFADNPAGRLRKIAAGEDAGDPETPPQTAGKDERIETALKYAVAAGDILKHLRKSEKKDNSGE